MIPKHFVSASCKGESCQACGGPATHKVAEEVPWDDPRYMAGCNSHERVGYLCCAHFGMVVGSVCEVVEGTEEDMNDFWISSTLDILRKMSEGEILMVNNDFKIGMSDDMTIGYIITDVNGNTPKVATFDPIYIHTLYAWVKKYKIVVVPL